MPSLPSRELTTEILIDAPPEKVWETLADTDHWREWNPVIPSLRGELRPGAIVNFTIVLGRELPLSARLLRAEPGEELCWRGPPQAALGLAFAGRHYMRLQLDGEDRTFFVHGEEFTGAFVPLLWWRLEPTLRRAYEKMNLALKHRVES